MTGSGCPLDAHSENGDRFVEHQLALEVVEMVFVHDQTVSMVRGKKEEVSSFWEDTR